MAKWQWLSDGDGKFPMSASGWSSVLDVPGDRRIWVGGNNHDARRSVEVWLADLDVYRPPAGPLDLAIITPASVDEAVYFLEKLRVRLTEGSRVWIVFEAFRGLPSDDWAQGAGRAGFQPRGLYELDSRNSALELTLANESGPA